MYTNSGEDMRKYYLFVIRKDIYQIYRDKPKALYKTLKNLSVLTAPNLEYGISLYHQICDTFQVERLQTYLEDKYKLEQVNGLYRYQDNYIYLKPARVIIQTNVNMPNIFIDFKCYNRLIFVVDFKSDDYFFLCDDYNKFKKLEYN